MLLLSSFTRLAMSSENNNSERIAKNIWRKTMILIARVLVFCYDRGIKAVTCKCFKHCSLCQNGLSFKYICCVMDFFIVFSWREITMSIIVAMLRWVCLIFLLFEESFTTSYDSPTSLGHKFDKAALDLLRAYDDDRGWKEAEKRLSLQNEGKFSKVSTIHIEWSSKISMQIVFAGYI